MMKVTDPAILAQLNSNDTPAVSAPAGLKKVTDPAILAALNGDVSQAPPSKLQQMMTGLTDENSPVQFGLGVLDSGANQVRNLFNLIPGANLPEVPQNGSGSAYKGGEFAGDVGGFIYGAGKLNAARKLAESAPSLIGATAKYLGGEKLLPTLARLGSGSAIHGAIMNPEDRTKGALVEGALGVGGGVIGKTIDHFMPSNLFRGTLTPEQLQRNVDVTRGTNTGLGDVLGSPYLKRALENRISKTAGSDADNIMAATAIKLNDDGAAILKKYLGNTNPLEVDEKLKSSLIDAFQEQNAIKNSIYADANSIAEKTGFTLKPNELLKKSSEYKDILNNSKFLENDPVAKANIEKILSVISPKNINYNGDATSRILGKPITDIVYPSGKQLPGLQEANIFAGELNGLASKFRESSSASDRNTANILGELGRALKGDIKSSIKSHGDRGLIEEYANAEKNYSENFSPFLDKEVYKFINGGKSSEDIVSSFIKTGRNSDKGDHLNKLMSKLDPESQDLMKYAYLKRAQKGDEFQSYVDPLAMSNLLSKNNLGEKQMRALFPDVAERKQLSDYSKVAGMNTEAINRMFNPKTGQRNPEQLDLLKNIGMGHIGSALGGLPGALAGLAIRPVAAKLTTKALTSPAYREKLVSKIIGRSVKDESLLQHLGRLAGIGIGTSAYESN